MRPPIPPPPQSLTPWLHTLRLYELQHLSHLTGLRTGTPRRPNAAQLNRFAACLCTPRLRSGVGDAKATRVLSVDMGVRNLAFCLLEVRGAGLRGMDGGRDDEQEGKGKGKVRAEGGVFKVLEWKRLDLSRGREPKPETAREAETDTEPESTESLYTPSHLSRIAVNLAASFIAYKPDTILIERQRFRSGGGPAVFEWTLRVNMLESMVWAALETMRMCGVGSLSSTRVSTSTSPTASVADGNGGGQVDGGEGEISSFPTIHEVNPQSVGTFWLAQQQNNSTAPCLPRAAVVSDVLASLEAHKPRTAVRKTSAKTKDAVAVGADDQDISGGVQDVSGSSDIAVTPPTTKKRSFEKSDKIALARYWLQAGAERAGDGDVVYDEALTPLVRAFLRTPVAGADAGAGAVKAKKKEKTAVGRKVRGKKTLAADEDAEVVDADVGEEKSGTEETETAAGTATAVVKLKKFDDLADCLVQGVTYALWEENRRRVVEYGLGEAGNVQQ